MSARLTDTEFAHLSAELSSWIERRGREAPSEQWDAIMDSVRLFRPSFHEGYCHGKHPPMRAVLE